jgi:hypothetical protein
MCLIKVEISPLVLIGSIQFGSCVVQPTKLSFDANELVSMIRDCGVNRLNQFPTFLQSHFRRARLDPKLLTLLKNLDEVLYSGLALPYEEENWARKNGIKLRVCLYYCLTRVMANISD